MHIHLPTKVSDNFLSSMNQNVGSNVRKDPFSKKCRSTPFLGEVGFL